jgi:hypothetical protein
MNAQQLLDQLNKLKSDGCDLSKIELGFIDDNHKHLIDGLYLHDTSEFKWIEFYHEFA